MTDAEQAQRQADRAKTPTLTADERTQQQLDLQKTPAVEITVIIPTTATVSKQQGGGGGRSMQGGGQQGGGQGGQGRPNGGGQGTQSAAQTSRVLASFSDLEVGNTVMLWYDTTKNDQETIKQVVIIPTPTTRSSN